MKFVYSLVRFVPDPLRGEFINVGAIVGNAESGEWRLERVQNERRARYFDDQNTLLAVSEFQNRIGRILDEHERAGEELGSPAHMIPSEEWLTQLCADCKGAVQLSDPVYCAADHLDNAVELIFSNFVLDDPIARRRGLTRSTLKARVRRAYKEIHANATIRESVRLVTAGKHSTDMDFAVVNGSLLQLAQTWSFQTADPEATAKEVRAWGYTLRELRAHGADIFFNDDSVQASRDVAIRVVCAPPKEGDAESESVQDAMSVFEELKIRVIETDEETDAAPRIQEHLAG